MPEHEGSQSSSLGPVVRLVILVLSFFLFSRNAIYSISSSQSSLLLSSMLLMLMLMLHWSLDLEAATPYDFPLPDWAV